MALIIKSRVVDDVVVLDLVGRLWILDLPLRDRVNELLRGATVVSSSVSPESSTATVRG